jgi:hypothetical protein
VTEPDPVTALAAQLEELRGQLARYTGETGHLRARLEADSGQVLMHRHEIKKPGQKITAALASRETDAPPAPYWTGLSREEFAAESGERQAWVDRVARVRWPGYMARIAPCWPNHPEAVWDLDLTGPDAIALVSQPPRVPAPQDERAGGPLGRKAAD